jgi:hypothetical protein
MLQIQFIIFIILKEWKIIREETRENNIILNRRRHFILYRRKTVFSLVTGNTATGRISRPSLLP